MQRRWIDELPKTCDAGSSTAHRLVRNKEGHVQQKKSEDQFEWILLIAAVIAMAVGGGMLFLPGGLSQLVALAAIVAVAWWSFKGFPMPNERRPRRKQSTPIALPTTTATVVQQDHDGTIRRTTIDTASHWDLQTIRSAERRAQSDIG